VQIDKAMIIDLIKQQAGGGQADQAEQELPDKVDPQQDAGLLQKFGVDPQDLIAKFAGGGGGGLGGGLGGMLGGKG